MFISLSKDSNISLTKQIYHFIREAILSGTIKAGEKLPGTRELSKELKVARNVVIESYEQLLAEGYVYTKNGSGTFVGDGIFFKKTDIEPSVNHLDVIEEKEKKDTISFRTGIPDLASIPIQKWGQLYREITCNVLPKQLDYQTSTGQYELRYQLVQYLRRMRGVVTRPENILITNGAAQAFSLLCQFVPVDGFALVENPLSNGIWHTLQGQKVQIKTVPIDENGIMTCKLPDASVKLIFTTPSHQFPTGVVLPVKRRLELIQYAKKQNAYIVEDDYDSEFRFEGGPIQSMQALDPTNVIYVGTFSKTLMPSLRLGYLVLPDNLCEQMEQAKYIADLHSPILEQLTMAKYIADGFYDMHIKKMKNIYLKRRNHLIQCLEEAFGGQVVVSGIEAGMHLVATFDRICFHQEMMDRIEAHGVEIVPLSKHYYIEKNLNEMPEAYEHSLIFGYGNTDIKQIEEGITRLRKATQFFC